MLEETSILLCYVLFCDEEGEGGGGRGREGEGGEGGGGRGREGEGGGEGIITAPFFTRSHQHAIHRAL